ncbi:MAG: hypothetical protein IK062_07325 [Selenomonadaceae bacterium]|nr:hypothetical protein [Selenomonadaceae bacterium]
MITKTAFEELYQIAEKFNPDVIACEKYYQMDGEGKNVSLTSYKNGDFTTEPIITGEDILKKLSDLNNRHFLWNLWTKLIRRDFFVKNEIKMLNIAGEDFFATVTIISAAEKIVKVPNVINFYRIVEDSVTHKSENVQKVFHKWIDATIQGIKYLDKFLNKQENFKNRADLKYLVFETVTKEFMQYLLPVYAQIPAHQLDKIIREEFSKIPDTTALTTFIFSRMNFFNVNLIQQQNFINQLQTENQQLKEQLQK